MSTWLTDCADDTDCAANYYDDVEANYDGWSTGAYFLFEYYAYAESSWGACFDD